mmetsp:Transcript_25591/g.44664  ORF Transcript_25591/g.44664 Transcript_25591/m.44664 type:complete len:92 (+) Transcript_25591:2711-2986(+)
MAAVGLSLPVVLSLFYLTSRENRFSHSSGLVLGLGISLASMIGVGLLTKALCSEYSALWAVGSLYGLVFQLALQLVSGFALALYLKAKQSL